MSELCTATAHFSTRLISDSIILFSSFILSHPLYFSYFIFFSPYLFKLISFLSPLFLTTFLLVLALLTGLAHDNLLAYTSVLERLKHYENDHGQESLCFESFEIYEILFGSSLIEVEESEENPLDKSEFERSNNKYDHNHSTGNTNVEEEEKSSVFVTKLGNNCADDMGEKRLENFLKILDEFEKMSGNVEGKKKKLGPLSGPKAGGESKVGPTRNGSEAKDNISIKKPNVNNGGKECSSIVKSQSQRVISSNINYNDANDGVEKEDFTPKSSRDFQSSLSTYGSMRKEKEWKRTLACKLFEERHNVDGGEGMDSLWEAYEMDSNKSKNKNIDHKKKNNNNKHKKKSEVELYEEEEIGGQQLCCLQALKMSAGKMNLGMGRPNLVKISKAIKGIGWLHNVGKHSKKVHNSNGDKDRY